MIKRKENNKKKRHMNWMAISKIMHKGSLWPSYLLNYKLSVP
jgi:hypothetical protein